MAQWKVTFRDPRTKRESQMVVEDATLAGANQTAGFFEASRGKAVKVEPVKA